MATLLITEMSAIIKDDNSRPVPVAVLPPIAEQSVTFTTSTQSSTLNGATRFVRLIADADVHIAVGTNPTATASSMRLEADVAEYFGINQDGYKIAAYDGTS